VTTSGAPAPALTVAGALPSGLTFTDNGDGTATLAGTPADGTAGDWTLELTATTGPLTATQTLTLKVKQAPAITSPASASFQVGVAGSFTVTTIGTPTPTLTISGTLPAGLSFTDNGDGTATIAGTPSAGADGTYTVTVNATNDLTDPPQDITLTVAPAASTGGGTSGTTDDDGSGTASGNGTDGTDGTGSLAHTGFAAGPEALAAVALMALGLALVVASATSRRLAVRVEDEDARP
jgi:hypothetical protein